MHSTWYSWYKLSRLIDKITDLHDGIVYDTETGKSWDAGQAVCREVYGPNWNDDPEFRRVNEEDGPAPIKALEVAQSWANGNIPNWVRHEG